MFAGLVAKFDPTDAGGVVEVVRTDDACDEVEACVSLSPSQSAVHARISLPSFTASSYCFCK